MILIMHPYLGWLSYMIQCLCTGRSRFEHVQSLTSPRKQCTAVLSFKTLQVMLCASSIIQDYLSVLVGS